MVYGSEGSVLLDGSEYVVYDKKNKVVKEAGRKNSAGSAAAPSPTEGGNHDSHFKNFVDAIRQGTPLSSPIVEANKSVTMLQLGNIAARIGRSLQCDPATARILNDAEAMKLWGREYEPGWEPKV